jgi:nucleotide-binding universal stress UspA family protein
LTNKILVATDFSENAHRAVEFAVNLAEKLGASVTIINIYPNKIPFGMSGAEVAVVYGENYSTNIQKISEKKIATIVENIKGSKPHLTISSIVRAGNPVNEIIDTAKNFDITVIGHRGQSNLRESFTGTTSERIIHKAKFPVVVVP